MSKVICVAGESGSGKTTSMRNLDPSSTFYFDCDKKGLSWKGWKKQYNSANKNYKAISDARYIESALKGISEKSPHIKVAIIDTLNGIMIDDEFNRAKEKGYDKWQDLATSVWNLVSMANTLRDDLTVIFTAHTQTERDDSGFTFSSVDGVLYDPPYSLRQVSECYQKVGVAVTQETTQSSWRSKHIDEIARIVKPEGKVISFGWNSSGIGKVRGFEIIEILLVAHGGSHNDTIVTVEQKL